MKQSEFKQDNAFNVANPFAIQIDGPLSSSTPAEILEMKPIPLEGDSRGYRTTEG
jgi:hypothetical protein